MTARRARARRQYKATHPDWKRERAVALIKAIMREYTSRTMRLWFDEAAAHKRFADSLQLPSAPHASRAYENVYPLDIKR
jgi:hypothetical protein